MLVALNFHSLMMKALPTTCQLALPFNYNGIDYTTINICANGFTTLGTPFSENLDALENFYINSLKYGPISSISSFDNDSTPELGHPKPVLAPLWDDLTCQADANLRYITTGSAGSHVFTFEWSNAKWQAFAATAAISFELKLYEGTNIIEFYYKDEGGTLSTDASASIGITASDQIGGGFLSLQNTSASPAISTTIEANNLNEKPANNQVYRFTPLPCPFPLNVHYDSYNNTSVTFSWNAPLGVTNFEYALTTSPDDPASGTSTTSTIQTISSLSPNTKYYIHVRSYCSASSQSVWFTISFITSRNTSPPPPIAWQKSFGGTDTDIPNCIKQTTDGGYIVAGFSVSNDGDVVGKHGFEDYWIVKMGANGDFQWQKSLGGSGDDEARSIEQTSDGGYIIAGTSTSNDGDVTGNHGYYDYWIVKLSSIGAIQWQKSLGGSGDDEASSIEQTPDGGYIVEGGAETADGDVAGNHAGGGCWIVKLNNIGTIQWQKIIGQPSGFAFQLNKLLMGAIL